METFTADFSKDHISMKTLYRPLAGQRGGQIQDVTDETLRNQYDELWHIKKTLQFELIETNFEKHDNHHFETTLTYKRLTHQKQKKQKFKIDFYFFVPGSLIDQSFSSSHFLSKLKNFLRLRSVDVPPSVFLDLENPLSPLAKLINIKQKLLNDPQMYMDEEVINEARVAASYILHSLKSLDVCDFFPDGYDAIRHYKIELQLSRSMLDTWRGVLYVYNQIFANRLKQTLESFNIIDEYISYHLEKRWIRVLNLPAVQNNNELSGKIQTLLKEELKYRERFSFLVSRNPSELKKDIVGEKFTYNLGVIKKFVQKQLYLSIDYKTSNSYVVQSASLTAAGIAAFFAYTIEFLHRGVYGLSWETHAWFLISLGVVAYMMKDRIKEITKTMIQKSFASYDLRRNIALQGISKKPFAHTIEKVSVIDAKQVAPEIMKIREKTSLAHIKQQREERTIHYSKVLHINWDLLHSLQDTMHNEIKEIYRFNIGDICEHMDNPLKQHSFFDPESQKTVDLVLPKVYHLNMILSLCPFKNKKELDEDKRIYQRTRLILDKDGIKRVETVIS